MILYIVEVVSQTSIMYIVLMYDTTYCISLRRYVTYVHTYTWAARKWTLGSCAEVRRARLSIQLLQLGRCANKLARMRTEMPADGERNSHFSLSPHKHEATGRLHIIAEKMSLSTAGKTCFVVKRVRPFSLDDKYRHFHSNPPPPLTRLLYIFSKGYMSSSQKWGIMGV
jgi:hypothetical protein